MKNDKRSVLSLSAMALVLTLAGCGNEVTQAPSVGSTVEAESVESQAPESSVSSESESAVSEAPASSEAASSEPLEPAALLEEPEAADFSEIADSLANFPLGTAGSSLKIIQLANEVIPYGAQIQSDPVAFVEAYREKSDEDPAMAREIFLGLGQTIQDLVSGDPDRLGEAESAGVTVNESDLSADEWGEVFEEMVQQFEK